MLVDLLQITTRDGVRLDGVYQPPTRPGRAGLAVDAFLLVHGTGGSFYSSTLLDSLAERLIELGCGVLRANTRGHDLVSMAATTRGGLRQGAAYEVVDDCRHDLSAWVGWLRENIGPGVGLLGHSLGAVKCLYAAAREPELQANCVVAVSPPRLSYSWFLAQPQGTEFREAFEQAQRESASGRAEELIEVKRPLPMVITAAGFLEKYGPEERYNYLRFLAKVPCPVLGTFGTVEVANNMAFAEAPQEWTALAEQNPQLAVQVIEGADHFYSTGRKLLADALEGWLRRVVKK